MHRRQHRLVVDAGIGHQDAHGLQRRDGAAFEHGHAFLLPEFPVHAEIDAARIGDGGHPDPAVLFRHPGDRLQPLDPGFTERLGVRHQVHMRDLDEVPRVEHPSDRHLLAERVAPGRAMRPVEHRLFMRREFHARPPSKTWIARTWIEPDRHRRPVGSLRFVVASP